MSSGTGPVYAAAGSTRPAVPTKRGSGDDPAPRPGAAGQAAAGSRVTGLEPAGWPLRTCLELGALPTAVPCARLHTRHVLAEWGLPGATEVAELLVSELVTNGVKASQAMARRPPVWLRLSAAAAQVLIEVGDGNPDPPAPRAAEDGIPGLGDEGGRGLFLVATLSEQWNWHPLSGETGKVVWCLLATGQTGAVPGAAPW
jgi:anti-sigma regulatory factor (Ser/Thr protein kinase)